MVKFARDKRHKRIRTKIKGTPNRPRVVIFRSNRFIYLQAVDDTKGKIVASSSNLKSRVNPANNLAKKLIKEKIKKIVFDRGGYQYHGKVKQIAENLRKAGLEF